MFYRRKHLKQRKALALGLALALSLSLAPGKAKADVAFIGMGIVLISVILSKTPNACKVIVPHPVHGYDEDWP